jgi:type I restriction enzyme S subunit
LLLIRPSGAAEPRYLEYVINSDWTIKHIAQHSVGTIQAHFNVGALRELPVPVPAVAIQRAAVEALDAICRRIDLTVRALASQIGLLAEHRQALITAAVTGEHSIPGAA